MIRHERAGFTVLEAAIAVTIIGLAAAGVLSAFAAETRSVMQVRSRLESLALAQDVLERVRLADPQERAPLADSLARGRFAPPFAEYSWTARIEPVTNEAGLHSLTVRVIGAEGDFEIRSLLFEAPQPVLPQR